ncbi:MAG: hypothetical protein KKA37_06665 [Alphaproteobacteria bacterium]|jgi:hypothetical protein|nr:hypothetical protein [Alphaproteobacteria bacterium]MBU2125273.1 hypothetical protein [Alphaproteobacteria bacterium]MBU2208249.1 hypothetical protein [Alphaproteobacteria bacterium]
MKKPTGKPDALDRAIRRMEAVERLAREARAVASMPTGTPTLDAVQDAAMAEIERAVAALKRDQARERR